MKQKTGRVLLGVMLALAMVAGLLPGMSMTAYADGTMVGQYIRTPGRKASNTMAFAGASEANPVYIKIAGKNVTLTSEKATLSHRPTDHMIF